MTYNDLNTKFKDSNVELNSTVSGIQSIKAGLERFLQTPKGHDPFNREYGCSLYNLLFKTNLTTNEIQMFLYMDITNFEPRIEISPADINITKIDNYTYNVNCNFVIKPYNNLNTSIDVTLARE